MAPKPRPAPEYPDTTPSGRDGYYLVTAFVGDYEMDHQPNFSAEWPTLASAVAEADRRFVWARDHWLPKNQSKLGPIGSDIWCVFVFEASDELGERPTYVRGNPRCTEE